MKHCADKDVVATHHFDSKVLKPSMAAGYYNVPLSVEGKYQDGLVHRLVAEAFIPNPLKLPQVDHVDGNRLNNRVDNLRWISCKGNIQASLSAKSHVSSIGPRKVRNVETGEMFNSMSAAEVFYKIPKGMISSSVKSNQRVHGILFEVVN